LVDQWSRQKPRSWTSMFWREGLLFESKKRH
jgi:hypothetical protein